MSSSTHGKESDREINWEIVEYGRRYATVGFPGGEWCLDASSANDGSRSYTLHPAGCCRGVAISGQHGLYHAIDLATAYLREVRGSGMGDRGRNGKGAPVYTEHMNVKLTPEQAAAIRASGDPDSTWVRKAVEERLEREWMWPKGKTFGELTPDARRLAARQAAGTLQAELTANAEAIGRALDGE
jgi:hypothetical protein